MINYPRLLDADLKEIGRISPISVSITDNIIPVSSAKLKLRIDEQISIGQWLHLYSNGGDEGIFRVISINTVCGKKPYIEVYAEHAICTLSDDYMPETSDYDGKTPEEVLRSLLNKQTVKHWQINTIEETAELSYTMSAGTLLEGLVELLNSYHNDYMLQYDFSSHPWKLSLVETEKTASCECRLSRNLESAEVTLDRSDMATKLYIPDWGKDDDGKKLTGDQIKTISRNTDIWGVIESEYSDSSAKNDAQLLKHANQYLKMISNPIVSVEIDARELSQITGESIDAFKVGKMCGVILHDYGIVQNERIIEIDRKDVYGDSASVKITLANRVHSTSTGLTRIAAAVDDGTKINSKAKNKCYKTATSALEGVILTSESLSGVQSRLAVTEGQVEAAAGQITTVEGRVTAV